MANNEIFQKIATDLVQIESKLEQARDLLSALKAAGEDTLEMESTLKTLEKKKYKWQRVLSERGY